MRQRRSHGLQMRVAAGSVDNGVKLRMQRHRVPARRNSKIRRVGRSIHHNAAQSSLVFAGRREYSSNALQCRQIRIVERIIPLHRRLSWIVFMPRPKQSRRLNVSHRLGIHQRRFKAQRQAAPNIHHLQIADDEFQRRFLGIQSVDQQLRIFAKQTVRR